MEKKIGFIGGGRIVRVFLWGFKNKKIKFDKIYVFDPDKGALDKLKKYSYQPIEIAKNFGNFSDCNFIFLAVHPPVLIESLEKLKPFLKGNQVVLSLAPKIKIEKIKSILGGFKNIVRVIPNASGIVNYGLNPVSFSDEMDKNKKEEVIELLQILGKCTKVSEKKLEGYAMITGMGPTYFWFQFEYLKKLAVSYGMEEEEAKEAISYMIEGALKALFYSGFEEEEVMDLIPVKPLGDYEDKITSYYNDKLNSIYEKIKN